MSKKPIQKKPRVKQPQCGACSHPVSFHGNHVGLPCKALGCHCQAFESVEVHAGV